MQHIPDWNGNGRYDHFDRLVQHDLMFQEGIAKEMGNGKGNVSKPKVKPIIIEKSDIVICFLIGGVFGLIEAFLPVLLLVFLGGYVLYRIVK